MTACLSDHNFKELQHIGQKLQDGEFVFIGMDNLPYLIAFLSSFSC